MNLSSAHPSQKFYGGGGENGFKEGRDDTAAGISSIKPFFNQEVVIVSMSIVTAWHDLEKQGPQCAALPAVAWLGYATL